MDPTRTLLLTDLYQLTMLQGYFEQGMGDAAVFASSSAVICRPTEASTSRWAGTAGRVSRAGTVYAGGNHLARRDGEVQPGLRQLARRLAFTGDLYAMPEGTACFPDELLVRIAARMPPARPIVTRLINIVHLQTLIASKAARGALAAPDKLLVDFGMRRAHGAEVALAAARSSYLAGFAGSATVVAEQLWGIPSFVTMAYAFIEAHDDESEAFLHFARAQPGNVVMLIDTYDTEAGAEKVAALAQRLADEGIDVRAVRLDSGGSKAHAYRVREILDRAGLRSIGIFSGGGLDEYEVAELCRQGAPIDGFGIGTKLDTSAEAPYLDCTYKLQEYAGLAHRKRSEGKASWPGRKPVYRRSGDDGAFTSDLLTLDGDTSEGEPLNRPVMRAGRRVAPPEKCGEIRERVVRQLRSLPTDVKALRRPAMYPLGVSASLRALAAEVDGRMH